MFVLYLFVWAALMAVPQPDVMSIEAFVVWNSAMTVPLLAYVALVALTTFALNPLVWLMTACGVLATHVTYGIRFMGGLLARRAPCEFIGRDHAKA